MSAAKDIRLATSDDENDWDAVADSEHQYHHRAEVNCPFHPNTTRACVVDGWSHDEEPWISMGEFRCRSCGRHGVWTTTDSHESTSYTGAALPRKLRMEAAP